MRSRMSSVLAAIVVISCAGPGCCAGFNRRNRSSDHGWQRTAQPADWMWPFVRCFTGATWDHVLVLVSGALLSPGRRTVSAALRVLDQTASFAVYHRVLSTARWSARRVAHRLLHLLVAAFVRDGPVVIGLDDTIERRWGTKIKARGIYRDPVRSSHGHFVKASGLRWLCVMLLAPIPWAGCVWALPFLTLLAPSERYAQSRAGGTRR